MNVQRPQYSLTWTATAREQLDALDTDIALQMIRHAEDVAAGRRTGKALGMRAISGDLTGYHRLKVDESGHKPERWRLVYELRPSPKQVAMIVIVVGPRSDIYKGLSKRLGTRIENAEKDAY